jgi:hypothetical protein
MAVFSGTCGEITAKISVHCSGKALALLSLMTLVER